MAVVYWYAPPPFAAFVYCEPATSEIEPVVHRDRFAKLHHKRIIWLPGLIRETVRILFTVELLLLRQFTFIAAYKGLRCRICYPRVSRRLVKWATILYDRNSFSVARNFVCWRIFKAAEMWNPDSITDFVRRTVFYTLTRRLTANTMHSLLIARIVFDRKPIGR